MKTTRTPAPTILLASVLLLGLAVVRAAGGAPHVSTVGGTAAGDRVSAPIVEPVTVLTAKRGQHVTTTNEQTTADALQAQCEPAGTEVFPSLRWWQRPGL